MTTAPTAPTDTFASRSALRVGDAEYAQHAIRAALGAGVGRINRLPSAGGRKG